jgi:hypothetical protein
MQFREQANKIQVLAYRGYDKNKRRSIIKMLGSFDRYSFKLSDGLLDNLTDEEKKELAAYIDKMRQTNEERSKQYLMSSVIDALVKADALLIAGMAFDITRLDADRANSVWRSIKALESMLETAGYPRPKRAYRKKSTSVVVDPQQQILPVS